MQKKYQKAVVFISGILVLLGLGLIMQGRFYGTDQFHPLLILGFFGDLGNGIFYFLIKLSTFDQGDIAKVTYSYGTTYLVTAGLLNYLVALNAFDIAIGKRK